MPLRILAGTIAALGALFLLIFGFGIRLTTTDALHKADVTQTELKRLRYDNEQLHRDIDELNDRNAALLDYMEAHGIDTDSTSGPRTPGVIRIPGYHESGSSNNDDETRIIERNNTVTVPGKTDNNNGNGGGNNSNNDPPPVVNVPRIPDVPDVPEVKIPKVPEIKVPEVKIPDVPKIGKDLTKGTPLEGVL